MVSTKSLLSSILLVGLALGLAACPAPTPAGTLPPTPTTLPADPATPPPASEPTAETEATPLPADSPLGELETLVEASLGITVSDTMTYTIGLEGVRATPLTPTDAVDTPLWLVYTYGLRNFNPIQNHHILLYTQQAGEWQEVARVELADNGDPENPALAPDYVGDGSVNQVAIEPNNVWVQLEGGVGAHSGVYSLFNFDGTALNLQVSGFSSSPGVAELRDLDGDGTQEVLIDASEYYVFCYACGVRRVDYQVWRWDGSQMSPVTLAPLPADAPAALQTANDQAVALADAGLWKDALATLDEALALGESDPSDTFHWNEIAIRLNATAKQAEISEDPMAYPLLSHVFYGDFAAAVDLMRAVGAEAIFVPESPLVIGTVAEGWEPTLADWLLGATEPALALQPDLAPAHFLHGWALYLQTGDPAAALPDVQQAAELAPDDLLYGQSVELLGGE